MSFPAQYHELREKMAVLRNLYCSRHYTQCAKLGELLLSEAHGETHSLHLAHLNFYTALSHDTLAREATLKNRRKEFRQAEKHYLAAINALSLTQPPIPISPQDSPYSVFSDLVFPWHRPGSTESLASSATSLFFSDLDSTYETQTQEASPRRPSSALSPTKQLRRKDSAAALYATQTPVQYQFTLKLAGFERMLENHLADVRALRSKASLPTVTFTLPSPEPSPTSAERPLQCREVKVEAEAEAEAESAMDAVRQRRKMVVFRPRFDPTSVRLLCREALAELAE